MKLRRLSVLQSNTAWMLASRMSRTLIAVVYFALLARKLGVQGYGAFAGTCALASVLAPFASLGSGNLLIRAVSRDRSAFARRWGDSLVITGVSGLTLTALAAMGSRLVLPRTIETMMIVNICAADLIFARMLDLACMAFQAVERLPMTAWLSVGLTVSRLIAAAWLCLSEPLANAVRWSALYLGSTAIAAVVGFIVVQKALGRPEFRWRSAGRELLDGCNFSISLAAQTIYNDIDKTMLARMVSLDAAGLYGAAYRIVDAVFSPVNALMHAAYPRFFHHGAQGLSESTRFAARLLPRVLTYCACAGCLSYFAAHWVPRILGPEFTTTAAAMRLLLPVLVLRGMHVFAADALTGAGFQGLRTAMQVGIAIANVTMNLAWLPRYSWRGACYSTLACDGMLAFCLWTTIALLIRRQQSRSQLVTEVL